MKNRSTHSGHCQACGALQKLPSGVLSNHGYTVQWGFFSGTCNGSASLPFELSCDLIKGFIAQAEQAKESTQIEQGKLRQKATEPRAWVHHYFPSTYSDKGGYRFICVEISEETVSGKGYKFQSYSYKVSENGQEKVKKIETYHRVADLLTLCSEFNSKYADYLSLRVQTLDRYIAWQRERIAAWEPGELLPHDAKDKARFEP